MNIAIIPARGGSKRIKGKNIKLFLGKPIIVYSIKAALESKLFDEIMVSTDDNAIAKVAQENGAEIPFIRSAKNSDDNAGTEDVLEEVFENYNKIGRRFEYACCIYPSAPFTTSEKLKQAFSTLRNENFDSVFPVVKFSTPIQRALRIDNGRIKMFSPENKNKRTQDFESSYYDSGQFYFFKIDTFLKGHQLWTDNTGAIILDEMDAQDIDNETDWEMAELKYSKLDKR